MRVPRGLHEGKTAVSMEIVTFVDASRETYEAVAYLRYSYQVGAVTIKTIASKNKVASLPRITVPRSELVAIVFGLTYDSVACKGRDFLLR